jgi:hypothetical protein
MLDVTWEGVDDDEFVTREKELNEGRRRERGGVGRRVSRDARADDALALGLLMQDRPLLRKRKGSHTQFELLISLYNHIG